jgi:putative ABC transport system permease protein
MKASSRLLNLSERWFRILQKLYPPDFRDEMGEAMVEAYVDRSREALRTGGWLSLAGLWLRALLDSLRNGPAERIRPAAFWRRSGDWGRDIELVLRRLVRSPMFTLSMVVTLTVGFGMFAVVHTAVQKILLDPMPYKDPDDLYYVWRDYGPINDLKRAPLAGTDIAELQKTSRVIADASALQPFLGGIFSAREGSEGMEIAVTRVSPNILQVLGVTPALGRGFMADEIGKGREHVVVLSHHLWKRIGAEPGIIGTDVRLQGRPFTVVGVLPEDFSFVRNDAAGTPQRVDAFTPLDQELKDTNPFAGGFTGLIRARRGSSPEEVAAAVDATGRTIDIRDYSSRGLRLYPVGLKTDVISRIRPALIALGAAGVVLVFMLMVNLASMLLARAAQREREVAVSRALGADTIAVVRSTLLEGTVLGLAGGALGTLVAVWGTRALVALAPLSLPRREAIVIDWRIAVTVMVLGGIVGLIAAALPAIWAARTSLSSLLAGSAVRGGGGGQSRWRRGMIVAQVALSLVLLSSGALVMRSFERLLRADPGFRPENVLTVRMRTPPEFFPKFSEAVAFQDRAIQDMGSIPGVTGASAASVLPLTGNNSQIPVSSAGAPGNTGDAERDKVLADLIGVRPRFVEVLGMQLLAGRSFTEARVNGVMEVMIDRVLANRFFPGGNAIGAQLQFGRSNATVIGVVNQARMSDVHAEGRPQILIRSDDYGIRPLFYVIRTTREARSILPEVQAAVRQIDPRVPVGEVRTMEEIVQAAVSPQAIGGALISSFAIGALLLAAMGLFGVVAGSVTRRRHEFAVRLALGADQRSVLRLVLKEGALLVMTGVLIGAPGIYVANKLVGGLVVGVSASDPVPVLGAALGLLVVTMLTCYVPARRALGIDPAQLLRQD